MEDLRRKFDAAPVTVVLACALVAVYALEFVFQIGSRPQELSRLALSGNALKQRMWWTIVTHLFLHANLLHLAVNVLGLWFIGPEVEALLGRARFIVLFFISGAAGGLLQTWFSPAASELIGASGSVCGILLSLTTAYPELPLRALLFFVLPVSMKARTLGRGLIVFSLVCAVLHIVPQIGHLAHLGGAVAGALLTKWWLPSAAPARQTAAQVSTDALLEKVMDEGIEGLSRTERRQLESLADRRGSRRRGGRR